jgi:acyl carrier protein
MNIEQGVKTIIANQFGVDVNSVTNDQDLIHYNIDSLDIVEIVMSLETDFHIAIEDDEYRPADTVGKIIDLVKSKVVQKSA